MNKFDLYNAKMGAETLDAFFLQFGDMDQQSFVVLDYLFQLLYNSKKEENENVFLPSETEQAGNKSVSDTIE